MRKENIVLTNPQSVPPKFATKDTVNKSHACLTTYSGIGELSAYLARNAEAGENGNYTPMNYDYFVNDEMLIVSAADILAEIGFSVREKQ